MIAKSCINNFVFIGVQFFVDCVVSIIVCCVYRHIIIH